MTIQQTSSKIIRTIKNLPKDMLFKILFFAAVFFVYLIFTLNTIIPVAFSMPIRILKIGIILILAAFIPLLFSYFLCQARNWARIAVLVIAPTIIGTTLLFFYSNDVNVNHFRFFRQFFVTPCLTALSALDFTRTFYTCRFPLLLIVLIFSAVIFVFFMNKKTNLFFGIKETRKSADIFPRIEEEKQKDATRPYRFYAFLIDIAIPLLIFISTPLLLFLMPYTNFSTFGLVSIIFIIQAVGIFLLVFIGILNIILVIRRSQTLGKYLLNIQVVGKETGAKIGFWHYSLGREIFSKTLIIGLMPAIGWITEFGSIFMMTYLIADSMFIFREDRRTIHDFIARTKVIGLSGFKKRGSLFDFSKL